MKNYFINNEKIIYTIKHRLAFLKCVEYLCPKQYKQELLYRAKFHDMDKVILNCLCDYKLSSKIHNAFINHHKTSKEDIITKLDYIEMMIDWECARYTKPDKPKNAYLTLYCYYPQLEENILPILKEFDLSSPENKDNQNIINDLKNIQVNEKLIKEEIKSFVLDYENFNNRYEILDIAINTIKKYYKDFFEEEN